MKKKYLFCKVRFRSTYDEEIFCWCIKQISCIKYFEKISNEFYLFLKGKKISNRDLDNLIGIFYRYKIDMKQLAQFQTEQNKSWFYDNKRAFWYKKVFGK